MQQTDNDMLLNRFCSRQNKRRPLHCANVTMEASSLPLTSPLRPPSPATPEGDARALAVPHMLSDSGQLSRQSSLAVIVILVTIDPVLALSFFTRPSSCPGCV